MPYLGDSVPFDVVYRHAGTGQPFLPTNHDVTLIKPDGTVSTAPASRVGVTNLYRRAVTVDQVGAWAFYPVTTDEDITPTALAEVDVQPVMAIPTAAAIAAAVWDEILTTGHTTPDSAAQLVLAAAAGAVDVQSIVDGILDELLAGHTDTGTAGAAIGLIYTIQAQLNGLGSVLINERDTSAVEGGRALVIGIDYTGADRLVFTTNSLRDLLATGLTLALEYTDYAGAHHTFEADEITGAPGGWTILVPLDAETTSALTVYRGSAEMAVYLDAVPKPRLGQSFIFAVTDNP